MKKLLLKFIYFYQSSISPTKPPCCRYHPTCSSYAVTAISRFGALRGGFLALWRLLRCNPFSKGGFDEVPKSFHLPRRGVDILDYPESVIKHPTQL